MRTVLKIAMLAVLTLCLGLNVPAGAGEKNVSTNTTIFDASLVGNPVVESLTFNAPYEVYQIRSVTSANWLNIAVRDCCIVGDMWVQRTYCLHNGRIGEGRGKGLGNTTGVYTGETTIYKKGPQNIDCITEVRYGEGVSVFPAGMGVQFKAPPGESVTTTVLSTLYPLPSQ